MSNGKNHGTLIDVFVGVIALLALGTSIWQGYEQRHHNRLSVTPALNFATDSHMDGTGMSIDIKNGGTGPAIVKSFTIYIDDKPVQATDVDIWEAAEQRLNLSDPKLEFNDYHYDTGDVIPANEAESLINIKREVYDALSENDKELWRQAMKKIKIKIEYTSIYEDKFTAQYPSPSATHESRRADRP